MSDSDDYELPGSEAEEEGEEEVEGDSQKKAKEHAEQLKRLHQNDPEFYQFLEQYDKELLAFGDEDIDDDEETGLGEDKETRSVSKEGPKQSAKSITMEMVDSWCEGIQNGKINPIQSILQAFRTACHYGDGGDNSATKFSIMSSGVFNKVMVFVLKEMDGILRQLLEAPSSGGKKETIRELMTTKQWRRYGRLMRVYLGNALHIITEMTDEQMIAFTLKRVKASAVFLAAFPSLLRKYVKVLLHTWARGRGAMPVVSFLFLRDLCVQLGPDCIDACLKGIYKAYLVNCKLSKSVSGSKLQYIQFLANCVTELYAVDPSTAYQHAFVFIRQLAVILRGALTERGPKKAVKDKKDKKQKESSKPTKNQMEKAYQKVYDWQYIFCLELWTNVVCAYSSEEDFRPLAYPLAQIIHGVACLIPSVRYFPLRLRCVKMLNRIAEATGTFIPVSSLLLDMLEMKELRGPPAGGVGKAVNLLNIKQVDKKTVKTRAFQEACVFSVVEELATHLGQWSYSIAFFEMSFIPLVRLRSFCKTIKADRFRREIKDLIRQVEANVEFINSKRLGIGFLPNDPAAESFLKAEKEKHLCPLSKYVATLHERRQNRIDTMDETSVIVGPESSTFARRMSEMQEQDDEGAAVFSSDWLPERKKTKTAKEKKIKKRSCDIDGVALEEDVVEDLILSSDEEDESDNNHEADDDDSVPVEDDSDADYIDPDNEYKKQKKAKLKKGNKWQQSNKGSSKNKRKPRPKKKAKS